MAKTEPKRELTDEVYTIDEVAQILKVTRRQVELLVQRKQLRAARVGRWLRIHRDAVWEFLKADGRLRLAADKTIVRAMDKANDARQKAEREAAQGRQEIARLTKRLRRQKGRH